jgi:sugar phosphate isomerase/epimerase
VGIRGHQPDHPLSPQALLDRAAALGVAVVQIADNMPLHALSAATLGDLERQARALGLDIEVGTRGIAPDHLLAYLRLAVRAGSPILRVVVDTPDHADRNRDRNRDRGPSEDEIVATLSGLMPDFEREGVVLAIENHDRHTAAQYVSMLERIASPSIARRCVGVCLDTANSFGALEGPAVVVETLAPWTVNVHVKDFVVARFPHNLGFTIEGRPVGQGQLDVAWVLERVRQAGGSHRRDPNVILEQWTPPEASLEATIAKEAAWAAESIAYLRRLVPD